MYPLATLAGLGALILAVQGTGFPADQAIERREPHPAALRSPKQGAVLTLGGHVRVIFTDGETTSSKVSVRLSNTTFSHTLASDLDFKDYSINVSLPLPHAKTVAPGAYDLKIIEGKHEVGGRAEITLVRARDGGRKRAPHPAEITSPQAGSVFAPGNTFDLGFHDGETDADKIQLVLKKSDGSQTYTLGTAPFTEFAAQGSFTIPADAAEGSYSLIVQENGAAQPSVFTDALAETVILDKSAAAASLSEIAAPTPSLLSGPPSSSTSTSSPAASSASAASTPSAVITTTSTAASAGTSSGTQPTQASSPFSTRASSSGNGTPTTSSTSGGPQVSVDMRWAGAVVVTVFGGVLGAWVGM